MVGARADAPTCKAYILFVQAMVDVRMTHVNVTDLRQNLPAYLERARRGERICVTSRGAVIAEIMSPKATEEEAELIRRRLRKTVLRYDLPAEPAHAPGEWTANQ
jgi:prevent-host-death family protein